MDRIVNKAQDFNSAQQWEISQELSMTVAERQAAALVLKRRVFGKNVKDVRDWHPKK
jgi:hypothetical protein